MYGNLCKPMYYIRPVMQCVLSVSLLAVALYVMLNPEAPARGQKWAEWVIAMLIGYWLRGQ